MKAVLCSPAMTKQACLYTSTKNTGQPNTANLASEASKASQAEVLERRSKRHAEPRKLGQSLRAQNACTFTVVRKQTALSRTTKATADPFTTMAPRTRAAPIAGPCGCEGRAAMNNNTPKNNDLNKMRGSATE
ncbi:hypothetical protein MRX96_045701 [Rhipicephalus microplus]